MVTPSWTLPVGSAPATDEPNLAAANLRAALTLLEALTAGGVEVLVLCPGSRSAPLAQAAALLESRGIRLVTAIDERSAGFWALGHGRARGRAAAVLTTSGTAVANLLPAAVEADWGTVPLLLLSADRPARLKNCGANQTVNQEQFLSGSVRWLGQGQADGLAAMEAAALHQLAAAALAAAHGIGAQPAGAVHLNLPFDEPLHSSAGQWQELWRSQPAPVTAGSAVVEAAAPAPATGPPRLDPDQPGVVVAGPWRGSPQQWPEHLAALQRWLQRSGWPLLADGLSGLRGQPGLHALAGYDLVLAQPTAELRAPQVLRLGPLPASRRLQQWLSHVGGRQLLISEGDPRQLDPLGCVSGQWAEGLVAWVAAQDPGLWQGSAAAANLALQQRWQQADAAVQQLLDTELGLDAPLCEPALARQLSWLLPSGVPVMLANSSPVRDWESFAATAGAPRLMVGFRGASGIDGTLSSACGVADALGQAVLISGDLALLHDSNGWLWRPQLQGRLGIVLINNGGGGIFEQLPIRHGDGASSMDFERLFAMPQPVDTALLCAAHGVPHRSLAGLAGLGEALHWLLKQPLAVLELQTDRRADAVLRQRLRTMAQQLTQQP